MADEAVGNVRTVRAFAMEQKEIEYVPVGRMKIPKMLCALQLHRFASIFRIICITEISKLNEWWVLSLQSLWQGAR